MKSNLTKGLALSENGAGGLDMFVERDSGNLVLILTGNMKVGKKFYKHLKILAEEALEEIELREGV